MRGMVFWVSVLALAGAFGFGCGGDSRSEALAGGDGDGDGTAEGPESGDGDSGRASSGDGDDGSDLDNAGDGDDPGAPPPNYVPMFPGAGTGAANEPLMGGEVCDSIPGATIMAVRELTRCFFGSEETETTSEPAATIEQVLECAEGDDLLHLRLTFDPGFVDNTYGDGSIGWPVKRGHRMSDLIKSDHAELVLVDGAGAVALQFKMDFISQDPSAPSGLATQGVSGGDGSVSVGDESDVVRVETSLDRNLNERGYGGYLEHSPATDESYTPNPDAPEWDFRMVYEVWIDLDAFGEAGFSGAFIDYVHASPAKSPSDTIEVVPGECPPCQPDDPRCARHNPPGDGDGEDPCGGTDPDDTCGESHGDDPPEPLDPCEDNDPDTVCAEGAGPGDPPAEPAYCTLYPTDPACVLK